MLDLEDVTNEQIDQAINSYIHSQRDRAVMHRRLIDGICFEPLADEFQLSVRQVKRIVSKCEMILFKHI